MLGVVTVVLFLSFISYVMLFNNSRTQSWGPSAVFIFVVDAGIVIVAFVVADVFRWFREQWKSSVERGVPGKSERK